MRILVINAGSSSLKYKLFDMTDQTVMASGIVERIGIGNGESRIVHKTVDGEVEIIEDKEDHQAALEKVLELLCGEEGVIKSLDEIGAVAHRVLHGKEKYKESVVVNQEVLADLKDFIELGPLHMPPNIMGIEACISLMPDTPQVAVFDTSFHTTLPRRAFLYGLPYELYEKYGVRRYGFHGTSHRYVSMRSAEILGRPLEQLKMITLHLGNGCSAAAIKDGKCIDTTMGFTPLEGLVMGTRCGDVDPAIIPYLEDKLGMDSQEISDYLNQESGLLGMSGISSDMRDVQSARKEGDQRARDAVDVFEYRIVKCVGAYYAALGGLDVLVFTAGIGENDWEVRESICLQLAHLGIDLDVEKNRSVRAEEAVITKPGSKVTALLTPTNEELMIATDAMRLVSD